jgi:hypothetical protein
LHLCRRLFSKRQAGRPFLQQELLSINRGRMNKQLLLPKEELDMATKSKPHIISVGRGINAKVWTNEGKNGPWYSATFARTYKADDGEFQDADSFSRDDLLLLAFAILKAFNHISNQPTKHEGDDE